MAASIRGSRFQGVTIGKMPIDPYNLFGFFTLSNQFSYPTQIAAFMTANSLTSTPIGGQLDNSGPAQPNGGYVFGNTTTITDDTVYNTFSGDATMPNSATAGYQWEYLTIQLPLSPHTCFFGYYGAGGGPALDPNAQYGGSSATVIVTDGVTSWIIHNGTTVTGLSPILQKDRKSVV